MGIENVELRMGNGGGGAMLKLPQVSNHLSWQVSPEVERPFYSAFSKAFLLAGELSDFDSQEQLAKLGMQLTQPITMVGIALWAIRNHVSTKISFCCDCGAAFYPHAASIYCIDRTARAGVWSISLALI